MKDKVWKLVDSVQKAVGQAGETASDAAYGVSKKAGELLSVAKLNVRIADLKASVLTALREVGELMYATHTGTPTPSETLVAKLEEVDRLKAEIRSLEEQAAVLRKQEPTAAPTHCPVCGAVQHEGDLYCRECGAKF